MSGEIIPLDVDDGPRWVAPEGDDLVGALEAMLFASGDPLPLSTLVDALAERLFSELGVRFDPGQLAVNEEQRLRRLVLDGECRRETAGERLSRILRRP